jgi:integrase
MFTARVTKRVVDHIEPRGHVYFVWDGELPGFGVRVSATGFCSYILQYRAGSGRTAPTRRLTLGACGKLTPDEARLLAKKRFGDVANGKDPAAERLEAQRTLTITELATRFIFDHARAKRKGSTAERYNDLLNRFVIPAIGSTKIDKVTRSSVVNIHDAMRDTPFQANRVLAVISCMYTFAGARGFISDGFNPARGIERYRENCRERFLTVSELERLGAALREAETVGVPWEPDLTKPTAKHAPKAENRRTVIGPHTAAALRLLILTGARLREILHLKWEHVDLDRGLLLLPTTKTGKKAIVLNAPAVSVLGTIPRVGSYVIAGQNAGGEKEKPRTDLNRPWALVSRRAGLEGVRIHDLRHTYASFGAGGGLGLPIIGRLLGHTHAATTQRYAHLDADPLRRASEEIAIKLATAMGERLASGHRQCMAVRIAYSDDHDH